MKRKISKIIIIALFAFVGFFCGAKSGSAAVGAVCGRALTSGGWMNAICYKGESHLLFFTGCPSGTTSIESVSNKEASGSSCGSGEACCIGQAEMAQATPATKEQVGEKSYNEQFQNNPNLSNPASSTAGSAATAPDSTSSGLVPCNTNCTLCHLVVGFKRIFDFFIKTLFVATMLAITVSGVFYMVSTGNKKIIEMAKTGLTYSLMAFVIGMGAWIIINTIMIGLGFKHPYGGNWWEFTCDTTPAAGPVSSGTSPNWGVGKDSQNKSGECVPTGNGCGGLSAPGVAGCDNTSSKLSQVMSCINQKGVNASVTSVTKNNMPDWCQRCAWNYDSSCSHVQNSCHFGGVNCKGTAQAADIGGANLNALAAAARECGGEYIIFYSSFIHVSVNNAECGCK